MTTTRVSDPPDAAQIADAAEQAFAEAERLARDERLRWHRTSIHTRPQPGCPNCPPTACSCGRTPCPDVAAHTRAHAASETTWREAYRKVGEPQ